ncbi:ATP-binding cassette domain-containing protein [Arachnia propionica]|uniref:ATP-binding cassette domain-containing protein n=1 Tax=Arachnia propionica TaxID=1750 RepID=UPI003C6C25E3
MPVASFTGVTRTYPGLSHPAVDNLSFTIDSGEVLVIVGANGSGKTTAMEILCGLRLPTSGRAEFLGQPVVPGGAHKKLDGRPAAGRWAASTTPGPRGPESGRVPVPGCW